VAQLGDQPTDEIFRSIAILKAGSHLHCPRLYHVGGRLLSVALTGYSFDAARHQMHRGETGTFLAPGSTKFRTDEASRVRLTWASRDDSDPIFEPVDFFPQRV
jgi:hypothetical protein